MRFRVRHYRNPPVRFQLEKIYEQPFFSMLFEPVTPLQMALFFNNHLANRDSNFLVDKYWYGVPTSHLPLFHLYDIFVYEAKKEALLKRKLLWYKLRQYAKIRKIVFVWNELVFRPSGENNVTKVPARLIEDYVRLNLT